MNIVPIMTIFSGQRLLVGEQRKAMREQGKNRNGGHIWHQNVGTYAKQKSGECK